jgi:hypothetical protein
LAEDWGVDWGMHQELDHIRLETYRAITLQLAARARFVDSDAEDSQHDP